MDNQWIVFYISSHGFGHMTRCLAIMEELLETTDQQIYVASGAYQNSFARTYLARFGDRVVNRDIPRLEHELIVFITYGKSADLNNIQIDNYDGPSSRLALSPSSQSAALFQSMKPIWGGLICIRAVT